MRRWVLGLVTAVLLTIQLPTLQADWLINRAVLKLQMPWQTQYSHSLNPPCIKQGTFPEIKHYLLSSLKLNPNRHRALSHAGRVLWLEGYCNDAQDLWLQAWIYNDRTAAFELFLREIYEPFPLELRKNLADNARRRAMQAVKDDETIQVIQSWYEYAFDLWPERHTVDNLIRLYQDAGEEDQIVVLWRSMADRLPNTDPDHWWAKGQAYELEKEWEAAALAYTEGAVIASDAYEFWLRAGFAWEKIQLEQAVVCYQNARVARLDAITPYLNLGHICRNRQQVDEALRWYLQAINIDPENFRPYYYAGVMYYELENHVQAQHNLQVAWDIRPDYSWTAYHLAQVNYDQSDLSAAVHWLTQAITLHPKPATNWWLQLGDWQLEQHNCSGARESYVHAQKSGGEDAAIQQKLQSLAETCSP